MQFELSEEQKELSSFVRELLSQRSDSAAVRATIEGDEPFDTELWSVLCEQIGAASLAIPEEFGGAGFSTRETHIVLEELGYALTPSPFFGSIALAAQALLATGHDDACERLLPEIAAGARIATLVWADPSGNWSPTSVAITAASSSGSWTLSGEASLVLDGTHADIVLAIAQTEEGPRVFEVLDADAIVREPTPALDPTLTFASLKFDGVAAQPLSEARSEFVFDRIRDHALTALSALQVGTAARGLDMTVEYSKQRKQFGRLIGSFQALKHRMADMYALLEAARTTSYAAAWAAVQDSPEWGDLAALAKASGGDALSHIAGETIQLHGGIAITWEHDAHLVFKRAHATGVLFGTAREQRQRMADSLGLNPATG